MAQLRRAILVLLLPSRRLPPPAFTHFCMHAGHAPHHRTTTPAPRPALQTGPHAIAQFPALPSPGRLLFLAAPLAFPRFGTRGMKIPRILHNQSLRLIIQNNRTMKIYNLLLGTAALCACSVLNAQTPTLTVQTSKPGTSISPTMYGVFFEDINYAADG